jgi:uncharacterized protein (TIGR03000 family)
MLRNKFTAPAALAAVCLLLWAASPASAQRGGGRGGWGGYRGGFVGYGSYRPWGGGLGYSFYPRYGFGIGLGYGGYFPRYYGSGAYAYSGYPYGRYAYVYGGYPGVTYSAAPVGGAVYLDGSASAVAVAPRADARQSMYYAPPTDNKARVRVLLPASARLWMGGAETQQQGDDRLFETSALDPGKDYSYELKATWEEGGRPVERTRSVRVRANETSTVDFRGEQGAAPEADQ